MRKALLGLTALAFLNGCGPQLGSISELQRTLELQPQKTKSTTLYFSEEILEAVSYLYEKYRWLGYDINGVLTHDIRYGNEGNILSTLKGKTMCVAAQMEIILTAFHIYEQKYADPSVFDYLPKSSWENLSQKDIKGHLWVNHDYNTYGGADALRNFGMGEIIPFEQLKPGAFVNINRTNRTGHAVILLSFIDKEGNEYLEHNSKIIGFKYFSSQGANSPQGGLDYRYAIFDQYGCPKMPYKNDCGIMYSKNQKYLNTGMMWSPPHWKKDLAVQMQTQSLDLPDTVFNAQYFNGVTSGD